MQSLLNQWWESQSSNPTCNLTRNAVTSLLKLAESDAERKRLRYAIVGAAGLSNKKAAKVYGFGNMTSVVSEVEEALKEAQAIRKVIEKLAELKDKELMKSLGISNDESSESDSGEESETDNEGSDVDDNNHDGNGYNNDDGLDSNRLIAVLQQCDFNWLEFVSQIEKDKPKIDKNTMDSLLEDFAAELPNLGVSEHNNNLIQQSRQVYHEQQLLLEQQNDITNGMIVSDEESDNPEEYLHVREPLDDAGRTLIMKRRAAIRRKAKRDIKKIAERRFLMRRRSKRVGKILKDYPDIGKTIEEFVKNCGVGADAWRRTGIYTFDGNRRQEKKVTFKRIQDHLQSTYHRSFSYGTVVQLCVARNKRRKSAMRYKGLAKGVQKRARKGFTMKYNPDVHWSAALYRGLDHLQYTDGSNIVNFGRDDQSGFRLDTMSTHKQHATLCLRDEPPLTTCVDYVNRYPSVLQTTSYNFPATETTGEVCVGVVKAQKLFPKNPAQHYADLTMVVEGKEEVKPAFINHTTGKRKAVECIRVDGAGDEGLLHEEVQYWWTKQHFERGSRAMLVSTRNSGSSYRNRVELQNGCLALGHANTFIPPTLHGSCIENGQSNEEILFKNLHTAIDVYISRVNHSPCADTVINLWKGADSSLQQEERKAVNIFLKGKKDVKMQLQKEQPELFQNIKKIWNLRTNHMTPNLPGQYLFFLQCCYKKGCVHPICQTGVQEEIVWYPQGPPINYLPIPTPDPTRPYGNNRCEECSGFCAGHYMKPNQLISLAKTAGTTPICKPPSQVILESFKTNKGIPDENAVEALSKQVLLPVDEVMMWLKHLKTVQENRVEGARKAAATRKNNRPTVREEEKEDQCYVCNMEEPPNFDGDDDESIDWIECDACANWFHAFCVDLTGILPDLWHCPSCN
ncbi:Chromatin modification-related YNG2 [Paramuricea clavata]|uniref:Chromatin modification-related YNG2 n=1 Tax=Paramuricea clavata TaxID=317549 RepID=A0A7D9LRZ9_PARCT|nr:Chromatin modification-related YNG2 [Paramuricea clavata]